LQAQDEGLFVERSRRVIYGEGSIGQLAHAGQLLPQALRRLKGCSDASQPTGVGDGGDQLGRRPRPDGSLYHRMLDAQEIAEPGADHVYPPLKLSQLATS
jgi:hypothetical protein